MLVQKAWKAHAEALAETALHYEKAGNWKEAATHWKSAYLCCANPGSATLQHMKKVAKKMRDGCRNKGLDTLDKVWTNVLIRWKATEDTDPETP